MSNFLRDDGTFSATGNIIGPLSSVAGRPALFADTTGKLLQVGAFGFANVMDPQFGAVADGLSGSPTDNTAVFQSAINYVQSNFGGGIVFVPPGIFLIASGITLTTNVRLVGSGRTATYLQAWHNDVTVITMSASSQNSLEGLTVFGKGTQNDTGAFGATHPAVAMNSSGGVLRDVQIFGGYNTLNVTATDAVIENVNCGQSYGPANVYTNANSWYLRCKFDHDPIAAGGATDSPPFSNWAATTAYLVGKVRLTGGYAIQCTVAGTSGGSPPTLKNYGINITDGTVTWQLLAPASYAGVAIDSGAGENHFTQVDLSSSGYTNSIVFNNVAGVLGPGVSVFTDCVISSPIILQAGLWLRLHGCELGGGTITVLAGYSGSLSIDGCWGASATSVSIAAGVGKFQISNNNLSGGAIVVTAGGSDHYNITNNINVTVTDNGTGVNKTVSGNVA